MKKLVMMKPFQDVKCFSMAIADETDKSLAPVLYFQKSSLLTDEEYVKLMAELKISASPNYIPSLIAEVAKADAIVEVKESK